MTSARQAQRLPPQQEIPGIRSRPLLAERENYWYHLNGSRLIFPRMRTGKLNWPAAARWFRGFAVVPGGSVLKWMAARASDFQ